MHGCCHQRRKAILICNINQRPDVKQSVSRFPILLRHCDQQRRAPLRITPVWVDALDQAQVDKGIALNRDSPHEFFRRDGDARRRFRPNGHCPQKDQNQNCNAGRKDDSPLERVHWAGNYTSFVNKCGIITTKSRARLRVSRDWTQPVERCMFPAVQIPIHAFVHFYPLRCTEYIVCGAT